MCRFVVAITHYVHYNTSEHTRNVYILYRGGENVFYPNIAAERAKRRMSQDELAKELGVTRKTIYNWENSGRIPQRRLVQMAKLFDCSVDYLLSNAEGDV